MAIRKISQQIKDEILFQLREGPISTKRLSEKVGSNWSTINDYLRQLKSEGKVREIISLDSVRFYVRTDDPVYYSLPFSKEVRDQTIYLLSRIIEEWEKKNKFYPPKTTTQKIAVEVIDRCGLDLPVLEFHYGKVTCMNVEPKSDVEIVYDVKIPKNSKEILECVKKIIKEGAHTDKSYRERNNQYEKEGMHFYKIKEELAYILNNKEINKEEIMDNLYKLSMNFPIKLEKFYSEFNDFISVSIALLSLSNIDGEREDNNLMKIKETFFSLWDLLTTTSYFLDAERFISIQKRDLFKQIRDINIGFKKTAYENLFSELKSELANVDPSELKMSQGENSKKIQNLILENLD